MHIPSKLKTLACGAIGIAAALAFAFSPIPSASAAPPAKNQAAIPAAAVHSAMPVAQQNALVQKYCEVCHNDAYKNGGISMQNFDAAHADPGDAAMMLAKLKTGAIGAAGIPIPDKATIAAWIAATTAEAAGASQWIVNQTQNPAAKAPIVTASIVQATPSTAFPEQPDLYRLTVTCSVNTREGQVQLLWSPGSPASNQEISAAIDGKGQFQYRVEGTEKMARAAAQDQAQSHSSRQTKAPCQTPPRQK